MKKIWKRILAVVCISVLLCGSITSGNMTAVKADDTVKSKRETQVVRYMDAVPGTAPKNIPEGYIFAGWYQKEDCGDALTTKGVGYAKFVDEDILRVKAQITGDATSEKSTMDIRFVTSVDTLKYRNVGFDITINGYRRPVISNTVYKKLYYVGKSSGDPLPVTPGETFSGASNYFNTYTVANIPNVSFGTVITVRACWTTQDGTLVYGEQVKKTIHMGIFQTEAIDYGMIFNCDNRDYLIFDAGNAYVTIEDYKEGAGALTVECAAGSSALVEFNRGENGIDISDYADGYLHFWLYVNDKDYLNSSTMIVELGSGGTKNVEEVAWELPTLQDGWNEISLDFVEATSTGKIDYEEVNYFGLSLSSATCQEGLVIKLDDLRAVGAGEIFHCNSLDCVTEENSTIRLTTDEYKEGSGALQCTGTDTIIYELVRESSSVNLSQYYNETLNSNGRLHFRLYVNSTNYLGAQDIVVTLGSGAAADSEALQWNLVASELKSGWNDIALPFAMPDEEIGMIDWTSIDYFSLSHVGSSSKLVTVLDGVRAVENEAQLIQTEETVYKTKDVVIADFIPTEMGYAVDATGSTDSTAGIQKALNDCYAAGGGTVYLPAGTYKITDMIDIPSFVTLRGDWQDPDVASNGELKYGTIICVEMDGVDETYASQNGVFELHDSSGAVGLTVYYPNQTLNDVKVYPYTFYVGSETFTMLSSIRDVTVINGYRGVGATTTDTQEKHESLQIENFKGTFLDCGIELYYSSDVGTVQNVNINNSYWLQYDGNQKQATLDSYTKSHTVGMKLGDVEWTEYANIHIDGCKIGVQTVDGVRGGGIEFVGSFYDLYITNCEVGLQADALDTRWGMNVARGSIEGSRYGVVNYTDAYIELCDVDVKGGIKEPSVWNIVNTDRTMTSYSWSDSCNVQMNKTEADEDNLEMSVTLTIPQGIYNTVMGSDNNQIKVVFGKKGTFQYAWFIPKTSLTAGKNTYTMLLSSMTPTDGVTPPLSGIMDYVSITGYKFLGSVDLSGVTVHEIKVSEIGREPVIDTADLNAKTIDYTDSYVKPDERILIANLSEEKDASSKLQRHLDWMAKAGGGVVYVPGGTYSFYQAINIPAGVELRGSSSVATRDNEDTCEGTLFMCYYGDEGKGMNDTSFLTLGGENAGVNGVRIVYGNNGPYTTDTNTTLSTSFAIRGKGTGVYVVNSMVAASAYGVDFRACDNHYIRGVNTSCYYNTYYLGGNGGSVSACLQNPTVLSRTTAPVSDTWGEDRGTMFGILRYQIMEMRSHYMILEEAENEAVYNNFAYGAMTMLTNIDSKNTQVANLGTDALGASSAQIVMDGGSLFGVNILRFTETETELKTNPGRHPALGTVSKGYKYIAGDLELRNRLQLISLGETGEKYEAPIMLKHVEAEKSARKVLLDCDSMDNMDVASGGTLEVTEVEGEYKQGTGAIKTSGAGTVRFNAYLDTPVNLAQYKDGQLCIQLYINDKSNLTSSIPFYVEIGSSRRCDCEELQWTIPVNELKTGWNNIVLNLNDAASTDLIHMGAIDYFRIYHDGNSEALVTIIDNIYATNSELDIEESDQDDHKWSEWI